MIITVDIKVKEGDVCIVQNYRSKYGRWEAGKVIRVKAHLYRNGSYRVSYEVLLNRRSDPSRRHEIGQPLRLTVAGDKIRATT